MSFFNTYHKSWQTHIIPSIVLQMPMLCSLSNVSFKLHRTQEHRSAAWGLNLSLFISVNHRVMVADASSPFLSLISTASTQVFQFRTA